MGKIKWGIIGCGNVTEVKSGPAFQKAENSELIAVMRRNAALAKDYASRHKVAKWYDDAELLIKDPEINAVYIATPPSSHMKYCIAAAEAGKYVYVEKPMGLNFSECGKMIEACKKNNIELFTAYYRRALPKFLKVKELIDKKFIGEVRTVNVQLFNPPSQNDIEQKENWRVDPAVAGGGYLFDLGSHMIDLLQYYFGQIKSASGYALNQSKNYEAEDNTVAAFEFEGGINGTGIWCFNSQENIDETEVVGSEGKIVYSTFADTPVVVIKSNKKEEFIFENPKHIQQPLIQLIVDDLLGKAKSPSTGESGASVNLVMDWILGRESA
jgi:predicted dehydrogenase